MDRIIEYLNDTLGDNYIYIIGIAAILLFILVGFLASRKDASKKGTFNKEPMANIDEITTGEINQVANTLDQEKINPVDVVAMPTTDALVVDQEPIVPVSGDSLGDQVNLSTDTPGTLRLDAFGQSAPTNNEDLVTPGIQTPIEPTEGPKFDSMSVNQEPTRFENVTPKAPLSLDDMLAKPETSAPSFNVPDSLPQESSQPEIIDIVDESPVNASEGPNVEYNPYIPESPIISSANDNPEEENQENKGV